MRPKSIPRYRPKKTREKWDKERMVSAILDALAVVAYILLVLYLVLAFVSDPVEVPVY